MNQTGLWDILSPNFLKCIVHQTQQILISEQSSVCFVCSCLSHVCMCVCVYLVLRRRSGSQSRTAAVHRGSPHDEWTGLPHRNISKPCVSINDDIRTFVLLCLHVKPSIKYLEGLQSVQTNRSAGRACDCWDSL